MAEVFIVDAVRTPIGSFGGSLRTLLPTDLLTPVLKELLARNGLNNSAIDEVIIGQCIQRTDEPNTARTALLKAGLSHETTGYTVQRQCASGLQSIINGVLQIKGNVTNTIIAGGVEAMSSSPYIVKGQRWGTKMRHQTLYDSVWEVLEDPIHHFMMGETAENVAEAFHITREEQDEIAYQSNQKAVKARKEGRFLEEIVPLNVEGKSILEDEQPRENISLERLASLPSVFRQNGTVTAGNSSSLNDGAAAVLLMSEQAVAENNIIPIAKIKGFAIAGVDPKMMGIGPVPAIKKGLKEVGWNVDDVDLFEINEAFASQYLAIEKELNLVRDKVNVNGSGISLGHPVGCTGARIVTTLVHELEKRNLQKGVASLCVGGGMGVALFIEL
jgi:acetyl-CoA C-acetyltransferase